MSPAEPPARAVILGAGAWGTALAIHLANSGREVGLWGHEPAHIARLRRARCNDANLPGRPLPASLQLHDDLEEALAPADTVLLAVPAAAVRAVSERLAPLIGARGVVGAAKGLDAAAGRLPHQIVAETLPPGVAYACLVGPSFADEVAAGLPTAVVAASADAEFARKTAALFHAGRFRVYAGRDVVGAELAGALKNVVAIAVGAGDGLGFGANAKAALITRGLGEIKRLALAAGARAETLAGLAGLGDLALTCTDDQSRNRRFGVLLGRGLPVKAARARVAGTIEGAHTAQIALDNARRAGLDAPIIESVAAIVAGRTAPAEAARALLDRAAGEED